MSEGVKLPVINNSGPTNRIDNWLRQPLSMGLALVAVMIYTFWRVSPFGSNDIHYGVGAHHPDRVVSPIFSPDLANMLGLEGLPEWANAAVLVLWIPFGFRGTCYYMRRVYYRSFFLTPVACWVDEPAINKKLGYKGEKGLFIANNLHRYFLYLAVIILGIKWYDVFLSTQGENGFILDIGTIVLAVESALLTMYVISCHAFRHVTGNFLDRWDGGLAEIAGKFQTFLNSKWVNRSHGFWFWTSLSFVFLGDIFVMLVANGTIPESSIVLIGGV